MFYCEKMIREENRATESQLQLQWNLEKWRRFDNEPDHRSIFFSKFFPILGGKYVVSFLSNVWIRSPDGKGAVRGWAEGREGSKMGRIKRTDIVGRL